MSSVFRRGAARDDLIEHFVYLAENAGEVRAHHFLDNAELTFSDLLRFPEMGSPVRLRAAALAGLRKWQVKDFDKFLIFYLTHPRGITIVRVLYAQQDWWGMFGVEQEGKL